MKFICPLLTVERIDKSKKFYTELLNQKIKSDFGENVTFHGDFAIHESKHYLNLLGGKQITRKSNSFELYFEEDKLYEIRDRLKRHQVEFIHEIKEQPWRQQVMRFYDPDGHIIEVGESMEQLCKRLSTEGMSEEEIAVTTGLPQAYITNLINT